MVMSDADGDAGVVVVFLVSAHVSEVHSGWAKWFGGIIKQVLVLSLLLLLFLLSCGPSGDTHDRLRMSRIKFVVLVGSRSPRHHHW